MPRIPAICTSCDRIFPSGILVSDLSTVSTTGCINSCTYCGGTGIIPDGVYTAINETALLLSAPSVLVSHLRKLESIAKTALKENLDTATITKDINDKVSELSSISGLLPKTRNELYLFLTVLIMLLSLILPNCKDDSATTPVSQTNINVYVDQAIENVYAPPTAPIPPTATSKDIRKDKQKETKRRKMSKESRRRNQK